MLVKAHSSKYPEDFGLRRGSELYLYYQCIYGDDRGESRGPVKASAVQTSPVVRVNALWLDRDIKVQCHVADTETKKREGLQGFQKLESNEGMYFPYSPFGEHVTFHQGSVPFGLDLIFIRNDEISRIEADTEVGSTERWACKDCSGVIEVRAGFCFENDINVGDRIALFAVSKKDLKTLEREKEALKEPRIDSSDDNYYYVPNAVNLISQIADAL